MGDCWAYKAQKVQIAWELAKPGIARRTRSGLVDLADQGHAQFVKAEISRAWDIVNAVLPSHDNPSEE